MSREILTQNKILCVIKIVERSSLKVWKGGVVGQSCCICPHTNGKHCTGDTIKMVEEVIGTRPLISSFPGPWFVGEARRPRSHDQGYRNWGVVSCQSVHCARTHCVVGLTWVLWRGVWVKEMRKNFSFAQVNRIKNHCFGRRIEVGRYTRVWLMGFGRRSSSREPVSE